MLIVSERLPLFYVDAGNTHPWRAHGNWPSQHLPEWLLIEMGYLFPLSILPILAYTPRSPCQIYFEYDAHDFERRTKQRAPPHSNITFTAILCRDIT